MCFFCQTFSCQNLAEILHASQSFCSVDEERTAVELLSDTNVELGPDGTASWTTPALLKSACKINIDLYPFDVQVRSQT